MEVLTQRLDKRRARGFADAGMNCAQLVEAFAPPIDREFVVVAINGVEVAREHWALVTPKVGTTVIVAIVPGKGGGSGKNPIALIASIAIAIVAPYAAGLALGAAGIESGAFLIGTVTYGQALGAVFGLVGNMLISAIFKPSQPSISAASASSGAGGSPTYSLAGQSNVLDPFGPVRRIFGTHRTYPVVIGRPYVEVYGDDQYLTTLYDIGAGDYEITDVRIGASHIGYFANASYNVQRNTTTPNLAWYWGARHSDQYNLILNADEWAQVDTVIDTGSFIVTFAFPTGIAAISETSGATLQGIARFLLEWSDYGLDNWQPVEAAYSWTASRPINPATGAPAEITDGVLLREEGTYGNPDDGGGSDGRVRRGTVTSRTFGYPVGTTEIVLRSTTFTMLAGARFSFNGTTYTVLHNVNTGIGSPAVPISPPLATEMITQVQLFRDETIEDQYVTPPTVDLYETGGTYEVRDSRIQQLALAITIRPTEQMVAGKRYSIRAKQVSGFGDERTSYGDMALVGVTAISATEPALKLRSRHTVMEMRVKANDQVSGTLEDMSCLVQSYLWVRRGGTWTFELSRSPAWALYEVLTGTMNKRPVAQGKIDLDSFEAWASYCEELHPATGLPRAMFDAVIDYNTTIFALAQTITASGRATLAPGDGRMRVLIDRPQSVPVQVFTPHNSRAFKGTRTFVEPPHAFRAKFMNRETWKVEEFVVYNDGYSFANASVFEQIELPGITREEQVWCDARYRMAQGIHRQESWTLDVDLENLICTRGDLVHVAHDVPKLGGLPARIKDVVYNGSGEATQWTLTEPVDFLGTPAQFGYTVRSLNGVIHQGQFGAQIDPYTVAPAAPVAGIMVGDLHVWGAMAHVTYPFIVATINPQADLAASITLVPYAGDAIFGADTGTIPPYDPVVDDDLSNIAPPPIARVTVLQKITFSNRRPLLTVSFDWRDYVSPLFVNYEVWLDWELNTTGAPTLLARSNAPHAEWLQAIDLSVYRSYPGTQFCVKVLGVNAFGAKRTLAETPATCDAIMGDTAKPAAPPYFELDLKRDTITLSWEHPTEPDIDFYEVRYDPRVEGSIYGTSTILAPQIAYPTRSMDVPARLGTYYIKSIDTSGNRSDEWAAAITPGENIWQLNVVGLIDDQPSGWLGASSGFKVSGAQLETVQLSPGAYAPRAEYYYKDLYDGGAIYQTRFTSKIIGGAISENSLLKNWIPLASATPIGGSVVLDSGVVHEIADLIDIWHEVRWIVAEDTMADWNPLASAVPIGLHDANFGEWRRFQVGDFTSQQFQFRLIAQYIGPDAVADVGALIGGAQIEIDMTDRIDGEYDRTCPVGGVRVLYDPAFRARPALAITSDNVTAGDRHVISNSDANGFDIQFFNAAASVARQFDWLAKGYGAQSARIIDALVRKGTRKPVTYVQTRRTA